MSVPGGSLPCAGVTVVGTYPTHRRRGDHCAAMMRRPARRRARARRADRGAVGVRGDDLRPLRLRPRRLGGRGEDPAKRGGRVREAVLAARAGRVSSRPTEATTLFPPVWEELARQRPGVHARSAAWWELRTLRMPPEQAANPKRFVVVEIDGASRAMRSTGSSSRSPRAGSADASRCRGGRHDAAGDRGGLALPPRHRLVGTTKAYFLPPDHPLFLLLANPRRITLPDGRLALDAARRRRGRALRPGVRSPTGSIVFEVRDAICPWNEGRWKLEGGKAERTEARPTSRSTSTRSRRRTSARSRSPSCGTRCGSRRSPGRDRPRGRVFGWRPLPWCPEIF